MDDERDFTAPDPSQPYRLDGTDRTVTYAEMTAEIDPELLPCSNADLELLLSLMGATPGERG